MTLLEVLGLFTFMVGICIGSFLNVVIYRLPRSMSLSRPASSCPSCGYAIPFYLNIPLVSWLLLRGKCKNCKAQISVRYFIVELVTGLLFLFLFLAYFKFNVRSLGFESHDGARNFLSGGWIFYLSGIILVSSLLSASAIDIELWVIPLSICVFLSICGIVLSSISSLLLPFAQIVKFDLFPTATLPSASLAFGAFFGLAVSLLLLRKGLIKRSYQTSEDVNLEDVKGSFEEGLFNHRLEALKELMFVLPIVVFSAVAYFLVQRTSIHDSCADFVAIPWVSNLAGSLWGYLIGAAVVWATRIFGTLGFGKEAMGMGDVHLMAAVGAVIGATSVTLAFFIAPFFGLAWAISQMFFKKTREIPYGPFLSIATILVMIYHDAFFNRLAAMMLISSK